MGCCGLRFFCTSSQILKRRAKRTKPFASLAQNPDYPTLPSKLMANNFCASTANSIGSLFNTSLQ